MSETNDSTPNVRATSFLLVSATSVCPACHLTTSVVALALPHTHQWRDEDSEESWYGASAPAVLFHVSRLGARVAALLARAAPGFRMQFDAATWCNHCEHCQRMLTDDELHCEPGGAFMPLSPAPGGFSVERIAAAFEALAGGYVPDPPFYPAFPRA